MKKNPTFVFLCLIPAIMMLFAFQPVPPQHDDQAVKPLPGRTVIASWFDSIVPVKLNETNAPCLVVSVTHADSIVFKAGYGYADLENKVPADPDKTIWRLASISKVVTGTAVMQLAEQGLVDLDRDVNDYLKDLEIPEDYNQPVTLRHLLTHTAGFDDRYIGKSFRTKAQLPPLRDFIRDILPDRIHPPGRVYTYSNVGNALMAVVVEDVTGTDFNDYCTRNIFCRLA